ncbi:AcrR family transcriptional regulator [Actinokineospora baliensis]|uniref:TetR/AcrR family transcriptional regulator n=1 Tax=Actinokineospora baliensis TaxID=547056 RepID=UPI00195ACAA9|nr:TetR family transcriptional regulator C-terminal domain-containing protein [Actinokineospora baliensis]MBM7773870.1 AcrR family transcriptional regulator [Actinokineospora baliensis]
MPRPSRAHHKRAELITAARQAVIDRGVLDLRLRDVADKAAMSTGSVLYYFPSLAELLFEVQREAVERFCVDREEAIRDEPDPRRKLIRTIRAGLPTGKDDELCVLIYELGAYARRDPAYAAEHIRLCERQVALYTAILETGSATGEFDLTRDATTIARGLVALEDGLGLHITQAVPTFTTPQAEAILIAHAADATRCELES